MTREVQEGIRTRKENANRTPPEKTTEDSDRSGWSMQQVSEGSFETHRVEMENSGRLRVRREAFDARQPSTPDGNGLDVKAREEALRKECSELASSLAFLLQDRGKSIHIRDVHQKAKERFRVKQSNMSIQQLEKKKKWLERCTQMKRLF
jgi:hypothetical protein